MRDIEGLRGCWRFIVEALCRHLVHLGIRAWDLYPKSVGTWCIWGFGCGRYGDSLLRSGIVSG